MLSAYTTTAIQPFVYTYAGSIIIASVTIIAVAYTLRDMLGGIFLAAIVYYLYTM